MQSYFLHFFAGIESLGTLQKTSCMQISISESVSGGLSMQQLVVWFFFFLTEKTITHKALCDYHIDIKNPWVIYVWKVHLPHQQH